MKSAAIVAAVLLTVSAPMAWADDDDCRVPMAQWQPREAVEQLAKAQGWTIRRIKIDDGCYEIKGRDGTGRPIEVTLDPGTLAVIKVEYDDNDDDDDDELPRRAPSADAPPPGQPPSNGPPAPKAGAK